MDHSTPARRLAPLVLTGLALLGCSHGARLQLHPGPQPAGLRPRLVLLAPVALRWDEPSAFLGFLRAQDVAAAVVARGQLALLGPGQLQPAAGQGSTTVEPDGADLQRLALRLGLAYDQLLVVRPWAERRVAQGSARLTDAQGRAAGASAAAEVVLVAHLELFHPATHSLLLEASAEAPSDPTAEHSPLDAQPELGPLLAELTRAALEQLGPWLEGPRVETGLVLAAAPGPALSFSRKGQRSLRDLLAGKDELEQDVLIESAQGLLTPGLDAAGARRLRRAGVGLLVREAAGAAAAAGIQPGDLVVSVDGAPAAQAHDLFTALLLHRGAAQLEVQRGEERLSLRLSLPAAR